MSTAQATSSKAMFRHFHDAVNSGEMELISNVIDEVFDRKFVSAMKGKDKNYLTSIPLKELQSGTSELKSWISLAGLLEDKKADMHEIDYVPCYRSPAGTGTANGFYWWDI